MSIAPLTTLTPGAHFIICNAGRSVSPVVERAPEICPSAPSVFIIIQPKYRLFFTNSRALSIVIPLFLRSSVRSSAYSSLRGLFSGSTIVALSICFNPHSPANLLMLSGLPMSIISAMPSANTLSAARSVLSSSASGSTMRCLFALARAMIWLSKSIVYFYFINVLYPFCDAKIANSPHYTK